MTTGIAAEFASTPAKPRSRPRDQSATVESLHQQLHTYREEVALLRAENPALEDQLARCLGAQRVDNITRPGDIVCPLGPQVVVARRFAISPSTGET